VDNGQTAFDPTALGPVDKQQRSRGRKGGFELDLGEVLITEGWIVWEGALKNRTRLDLVPADDVSLRGKQGSRQSAWRMRFAARDTMGEAPPLSGLTFSGLWRPGSARGSWQCA
jgi:hypothetical protein